VIGTTSMKAVTEVTMDEMRLCPVLVNKTSSSYKRELAYEILDNSGLKSKLVSL